MGGVQYSLIKNHPNNTSFNCELLAEHKSQIHHNVFVGAFWEGKQ